MHNGNEMNEDAHDNDVLTELFYGLLMFLGCSCNLCPSIFFLRCILTYIHGVTVNAVGFAKCIYAI